MFHTPPPFPGRISTASIPLLFPPTDHKHVTSEEPAGAMMRVMMRMRNSTQVQHLHPRPTLIREWYFNYPHRSKTDWDLPTGAARQSASNALNLSKDEGTSSGMAMRASRRPFLLPTRSRVRFHCSIVVGPFPFLLSSTSR